MCRSVRAPRKAYANVGVPPSKLCARGGVTRPDELYLVRNEIHRAGRVGDIRVQPGRQTFLLRRTSSLPSWFGL